VREPTRRAIIPRGIHGSGGDVRLITTLVAAAFLAVGALAACGDDDGETSAETDATTAVPAAEGTTTAPAGDGDDEGSSSGGGGMFLEEVCPLLEGVDVDGLLGEEGGEPQPSSGVCRIRPASEDSSGNLQLVVNTDRGGSNFDRQKELFGVDSEVDGLGDEAFRSGAYLFVRTGDTLVFMQVVRDAGLGAGGVDDARLEAAMTTVLENLDAA
jgi:hypothetical protein